VNGWDPVRFADWAAAQGFRWVAVQAEELASTPAVAVATACRDRGVLCGVWEAAPDYGSAAPAAVGFDFYIGQVEGPGQYDRLRASLDGFRAAHPRLPAAVVTNGGGFTWPDGSPAPELAEPFVSAGFACIAEGHVREDGVDPVVRADWLRRYLGWPVVQPMAGLGGGATLDDYPGLRDQPGWSVFGAEELWS